MKTAYYSAKVPIWVDEISDLQEWRSEFLKPEAKEVVEAVGAWVCCFRTSGDDESIKEAEQTVKAIQEICEEHVRYGAESVMLAVAMPSSQAVSSKGIGTRVSKADAWDNVCLEHGFEYVDYTAKGTNEFGEKQGLERLKEALEANEWAATVHPDSDADLEDELDFNNLEDPFTRRDEAEMTAELFGVKAALAAPEDFEDEVEEAEAEAHGGQEKEVEDLDRLMGKLLAVKEQVTDLPEAQRKRMAARAVKEVMGE